MSAVVSKEIDALPKCLIAAIALERFDAGVDEAVPLESLPAGQLGTAQIALEPLLLKYPKCTSKHT